MPAKMPSLNGTAPANPPATPTHAARPAPTPAAAPPATPRQPTPSAGNQRSAPAERDGEGVARQEGDTTTPRGSEPYPKWDSFTTPWPSGNNSYLCSFNKIVQWPFGTIITLRVEVGPERGRTFDWRQSERDTDDADKRARFRSNLFSAYAAGGWPLEADTDSGWPGWEKNRNGVSVPPYDQAFVHRAPDGVLVPVIIKVDTWTGDKADSTPFVNAIRHYVPFGSTLPVQAPMPYHVPKWLANVNQWASTPDIINTNKYGPVNVEKVDYKQIPFGHGGLKTMRDLKG